MSEMATDTYFLSLEGSLLDNPKDKSLLSEQGFGYANCSRPNDPSLSGLSLWKGSIPCQEYRISHKGSCNIPG